MPDLMKNTNGLPFVSCIMPTYNRRKFVPYAIDYFLRQHYANKELIVVDDGNDIVQELIPQHPSIRYFRLNKKITLGAKLNLACTYACGDIIANWDDDDWYAPTRLQYQVEALSNTQTEVCGINNLLYYDVRKNRGYRYIYPSDQRLWLLGSSLCYTKKLWSHNRFADIDIGMDGLFIWKTSPECVKALEDSTMSVHIIHENNISPKKTTGAWWHSYPVEELQKIMQHDWEVYKNGNTKPVKKAVVKKDIALQPPVTETPLLKNVYACLVHNSKECIIDLVKNLNYNDPSSIILLYNGGNNKTLFDGSFNFEKYNAFIHPETFLIKHGYLHHFALHCMEYAIEHFSFDTITMVDSDQLIVKSGYSKYLMASSALQPGVGMLSNKPQRLVYNENYNTEVWPAMQAFKEYNLWKPLLQKFAGGEDKFVHWTYWPSCIFSAAAARDLVRLFKEDKTLQSIMQQTKIWATEEVILPTLVAVLGYKIGLNPCSYNYVKYQKSFSVKDVEEAIKKPGVLWMHPVRREFNDVIRKKIRENFNLYIKESTEAPPVTNELLPVLPLLNKIRKIDGWLTDEEADLLIATTVTACMQLPQPMIIAEVGCYHGRSTIVFGSVLQKFSPGSKIFSIDPHDGKQGAAGQCIFNWPPSYERFQKNIEEAGLTVFVEAIKEHACNVKWQQPVSILFIDGLHDYVNVSKDFGQFANWLAKDAYVIFHDYANYFPGVKIFVNELLQTGEYIKVDCIHSLIVIKKL